MGDRPTRDTIGNTASDSAVSGQPPTRASFRIPLHQKSNFTLTIDGHPYPIFDISDSGIGLSLETDTEFYQGQTFTGCVLKLKNIQIAELQAQVMHCSSNQSGAWLYGLVWIDLEKAKQEDLTKSVQALKKAYLKRGPDQKH